MRNAEGLEKQNPHVNCLITHMFMGLEHEKKDTVNVPQGNEILSLYCTVLSFISKN